MIETLFVSDKDGNDLLVKRGSYNTIISTHVSGTDVKLITSQDNEQIKLGDDFGI